MGAARVRRCRGPAAEGDGRETGMVSAELAAAFPVVVLALVLVLGVAQHGITASRAQEAARLAARSAARGDPVQESVELARRAAPNATVRVADDGGRVMAVVIVPARGPTAWLIPSGRFEASAVALREEDSGGASSP